MLRRLLLPLSAALPSCCQSRTTLLLGVIPIHVPSVRALSSSSPDVAQNLAEVDEKRSPGSVLRDVYTRLGIPLKPDVADLPDVTEAELLKKIRFLRQIGFDNKRLTQVAVNRPPLLTLDIVQQLTPFLLRLQSLGLKVTLLGKLFSIAPFVGGNLSEIAFEERIQALKNHDFSASQIRTILVRLSRNDHRFVQFVGLPLENLSSLLTSLESLGLEKEEARDFVTVSPSLLFYDIESNISSLETIMGDRKSVAKLVTPHIELLKCNPERLKEVVEFMTGLLERHTLAAYIEERCKIVLLGKQALQSVVDFLESLGLEKKSALILAVRRPYLVDVGTKRLKMYADFLQRNGLDSEAVLKLIEVNPRLFDSSISSLTAKLEMFKDRGFEGENLKKLLRSNPELLTYSLEKMTSKVEFLDKLAIGPEDSVSTLKVVIGKTARTQHKGFQSRMDWLAGLGLSNDAVLEMVKKLPSVLSIDDTRIERKVDYLVNTMGYPVQDLVSAPTYLCCSVKSKIEPRLKVISWLKSIGVLEKNPPLSMFVESEESFMKQFVDPYPQGLVIYRGDDKAEKVDEINCT